VKLLGMVCLKSSLERERERERERDTKTEILTVISYLHCDRSSHHCIRAAVTASTKVRRRAQRRVALRVSALSLSKNCWI